MRHLGRLIIVAGLAIWVLGFIAWTFGVWVTVPPSVVRFLVLSLAGVGGAALLAAGAALSRSRTRRVRDAERV